MKIIKLISGFMITLGTLLTAQEKNSVLKIEDALRNGRISYEEALRFKYQFLHHSKELPSEYRSDSPVKCSFGIANEIAMKSKDRLMSKTEKPVSACMFVHPFTSKGQPKSFRIYYDTTGYDAVPSLDANGNGIRDWVEETALAFEKAYRTEVDTLGYREPLNFQIYGFYPVYISDQGAIYGGTTPDSQITSNPWTYTSYIEVDNDYIGNFYTKGFHALRVTCAHEFHHAVQLAYQNTYSDGDGWFYEVTATWMEDVVYPEVNDYLDYLKFYFNQPQLSLDHFDGAHEYAMAIWNHFIQKYFNRLMIRKVWEKIPYSSALDAWDLTLSESSNFNLSSAILEFSKWNYYTNYRADTVHYYQEGYLYPFLRWQSTAALTDSLSYSGMIHNLSSSVWYRFSVIDTTGALIRFSGLPSNDHYSLLMVKTSPLSEPVSLFYAAAATVSVDHLLPGDTCVVAVINKTWKSNAGFGYSFSIQPTHTVAHDLDLKVYPNPVKVFSLTDKVSFSFRLNKKDEVSFDIYSVSGKLIYRQEKLSLQPDLYLGSNALTWNGRDMHNHEVPAGIYIYYFRTGTFSKTGKIGVIR